MKIKEKVLKEVPFGVYKRSYEEGLIITTIEKTLAEVGKIIDDMPNKFRFKYNESFKKELKQKLGIK